MFRENYQKLNRCINPDERLVSAVLAASEKYPARKRKFSLRIAAAAIAAVIVCTSVAVPAVAVNDESFYHTLYKIFPAAAQFFKPVNKIDVDNGIKMEVVSAYVHENTAEIYVTMQDLTGDRIDETMDLYDSYSINRPFGGAVGCYQTDYDPETKTATFYITLDGCTDFGGNKITFSVREFLSHKRIYDDVPIPLDLSAVTEAESTQEVELSGAGGTQLEKYLGPFGEGSGISDRKVVALVPDSPMDGFPIEGVDLTGIGYVDGLLHIQTAVKDQLNNDNHGYFYLKDSDGKVVYSAYTISFPNHWEREGRVDYEDFVFDIPTLKGCSLYGCFVTCKSRTEGDWSVTFPLEKEE